MKSSQSTVEEIPQHTVLKSLMRTDISQGMGEIAMDTAAENGTPTTQNRTVSRGRRCRPEVGWNRF
jgi:hypothetical protein